MKKKPLLTVKITGLRHNYGQAAVDHFISNNVCEHCGEDRLVLLNIHHPKGKLVDEFTTLCYNCHFLEHNQEHLTCTYESSCEDEKKRLALMQNKELLILNCLESGMSIRKIIPHLRTSLATIREVMSKYGFESVDRKGYVKKFHSRVAQ